MLGVLVVILRRHRVAGRLRIACELNVFLGNVRRCAADFDVRPVRFVDPGEWIVAFAVSPPHTLVLTVSHGLRVRQPLIGATSGRRFPYPDTLLKTARPGCSPRQARTSNAGPPHRTPQIDNNDLKSALSAGPLRCCPHSITIAATLMRLRQCVQPMKHPDPK